MEDELSALDIEKKQKEIKKLDEEIADLRRGNSGLGRFIQFLPLISTLILVFVGGLLTKYWDDRRQEAESRSRTEETDREIRAKDEAISRENRNRFYDRQATVYFELAKVAAAIPAATDPIKKEAFHKQFLEIYNGSLRIADINTGQVLAAAKIFEDTYTNEPKNKERLELAAQHLADACQDQFIIVWGIH